MRPKHIILISIVLLSEAKALFYYSSEKIRFTIFSDEKKFLCNVVEDYSNVLIFGILFYYFAFSRQDIISRKICVFLFILNTLDLVHFGFLDIPYFVLPKWGIAFLIFYLWSKSKKSHLNF